MKMKMGRSEMIVDCYELNYKNFGKCVCIDNHIIKLMATLDVGPRIIYFGLSNGENILSIKQGMNYSLYMNIGYSKDRWDVLDESVIYMTGNLKDLSLVGMSDGLPSHSRMRLSMRLMS